MVERNIRKIEKTCIICGKSFLTTSNSHRPRVTCSTRCFIIYEKYQRHKNCLFFNDESNSWTKLSLEEYIKEELRLYDQAQI